MDIINLNSTIFINKQINQFLKQINSSNLCQHGISYVYVFETHY